jgi:hypothetical protein
MDNTGGNFLYCEASGSSANDVATLTSPLIDLTTLSNPGLYFDEHRYSGATIADMDVEISNDFGSTWTNVYSVTGDVQTAAGAAWTTEFVSLSAYMGDTIIVRFTQTGNGCCGDAAIDNFRIIDPITCPAPTAFSLVSTTTNSGTVTWDTTGISTATFELEYGTAGFTPGAGTRVNIPSNNTFTLTGLNSPNLCLEGYLRARCGTDSSLWVGPISICPEEITCDNIDQYAVGPIDAQSSLFVGWQSGSAGDATVSTTQSQSGTQSMRVTDLGTSAATDIVAYFDTITSGAWNVSFSMYVPATRGAYYNIQQNHALNGVGNLWNAEVYFLGNGTGQVQHSAAATVIGTFNYNQGQWFTMNTVVDLANDTIWFEINGSPLGLGYTYTDANAPLQFNGVNFYSGVLAGNSYQVDYYVDNFCITPYVPINCPAPAGLNASKIGCDSAEVSWTSNVNNNSILEYGPTGFTPGTGTVVPFITSPYVITGLSPSTMYDFYVVDTCASDTSNLVGPVSFTTTTPLPATASFTYTSAFMGNTQVITFDGSGSTNAASYLWDFGNGNSGTGVNPPAETYTLPNAAVSVKLTVSDSCGGTDDTTVAINTTIGLVEPDFAKSLSIYPNPSEGVFNISFTKPDGGKLTFEVVDATGKRVYFEEIDPNYEVYEGVIDLTQYSQGVYMLKINSDSGNVNRRLTKF